jgi:F0F1-type ATP synthase membrane subunit b/b'
MELINSIFEQLGINKTFYIQLFLVSISVIILSRFVFNRVLETLVLRDEKTRLAKKEAEELVFEYDRIKKEYDIKWNDYENRAKQIRISKIDEYKRKADADIRSSKEKMNELLEQNRAVVQKELSLELVKLNGNSKILIDQIKDKLFKEVV